MRVVLVSGGTIEDSFVDDFMIRWNPQYSIGVDRGCLYFYRKKHMPDLIVGDFDSLPEQALTYFQGHTDIRRFQPEKDATDTEIGIQAALDMGADEIAILGGTGTRLDHVIGNIQSLMIPLRCGKMAFLQDVHNRIRLLNRPFSLRKEQMFGKYVSFFPLTTTVEDLCLTGFKYPLDHYTCTSDTSLCVSNEVVADEAQIAFSKGILVMIESQD